MICVIDVLLWANIGKRNNVIIRTRLHNKLSDKLILIFYTAIISIIIITGNVVKIIASMLPPS